MSITLKNVLSYAFQSTCALLLVMSYEQLETQAQLWHSRRQPRYSQIAQIPGLNLIQPTRSPVPVRGTYKLGATGAQQVPVVPIGQVASAAAPGFSSVQSFAPHGLSRGASDGPILLGPAATFAAPVSAPTFAHEAVGTQIASVNPQPQPSLTQTNWGDPNKKSVPLVDKRVKRESHRRFEYKKTPTCPRNYRYSDGKCVIKQEVSLIVVCPPGSVELDSGECVRYTEPEYECPSGATQQSPDAPDCIIQRETDKVLACPLGSISKGGSSTECYLAISHRPTCPEGTAIEGEQCARYIPKRKQCPEGTKPLGDICAHRETTTPVVQCPLGMKAEDSLCKMTTQSLPVCPPSTIDNGDGRCLHYAAKVLSCPPAYRPHGADSCRTVHRQPLEQMCANGADPNDNCKVMVPMPLSPHCPRGKLYGGDTCAVVEDHKVSTKCPDEYYMTENGERRCVKELSYDCGERREEIRCSPPSLTETQTRMVESYKVDRNQIDAVGRPNLNDEATGADVSVSRTMNVVVDSDHRKSDRLTTIMTLEEFLLSEEQKRNGDGRTNDPAERHHHPEIQMQHLEASPESSATSLSLPSSSLGGGGSTTPIGTDAHQQQHVRSRKHSQIESFADEGDGNSGSLADGDVDSGISRRRLDVSLLSSLSSSMPSSAGMSHLSPVTPIIASPAATGPYIAAGPPSPYYNNGGVRVPAAQDGGATSQQINARNPNSFGPPGMASTGGEHHRNRSRVPPGYGPADGSAAKLVDLRSVPSPPVSPPFEPAASVSVPFSPSVPQRLSPAAEERSEGRVSSNGKGQQTAMYPLPVCHTVLIIKKRTCHSHIYAEPEPVCGVDSRWDGGDRCITEKFEKPMMKCDAHIDSEGKCFVQETSQPLHDCPHGYTDTRGTGEDDENGLVCEKVDVVGATKTCPDGTEAPDCAAYTPKECPGGECVQTHTEEANLSCPPGYNLKNEGSGKSTCYRLIYEDRVAVCPPDTTEVDPLTCASYLPLTSIASTRTLPMQSSCPPGYSDHKGRCVSHEIIPAEVHCGEGARINYDAEGSARKCAETVEGIETCPVEATEELVPSADGNGGEHIRCWIRSVTEPVMVDTVVVAE